MSDGTYGIRGLPRPGGLPIKTKNIPYVPGMPARHNISKVSKDPAFQKQWTLFVLALEKFKNKPVKDKLSYFQIAGIHVSPNQPWDGAPSPPSGEGHIIRGYCFHNAHNFSTWHRPYMLLFEQCIWDNMKDVIQHWVDEHGLSPTEATQWHRAANAWRLPYWDWAGKQSYADDFGVPEVLVQGHVRIHPPASLKKLYPPNGLYPNPFWEFENPEKDVNGNPRAFGDMPDEVKAWNIPADEDNNDYKPWNETTTTSRYGVFRKVKKVIYHYTHPPTVTYEYKYRGLTGMNNAWTTNAVLQIMKGENKWYKPDKRGDDHTPAQSTAAPTEPDFVSPGTFSDAVNRMFSPGYYKYWEEFCSTRWYSEDHNTYPPMGYLSLEYIHNNVHNLTGGNEWGLGLGHMGDVKVAAFDPVFWLHHCQVDRVLALWQALNWEHWWDGPSSKGEDPNHADDRWAAYEPLHLKDNDPERATYRADMIRDWTQLNYSYDDLDEVALQAHNHDGTLDEAKFKRLLRDHLNTLYPGSAHMVASIRNHPTLKVPAGLAPSHGDGDGWRDYIINVVYDRYALQGQAYSIEFYLGGDKDSQKTTFHPRNYIGRVYTFSNSQGETCPNCTTQQEGGILSRAQVPLTLHLLHHVTDSVSDHNLGSFLEDDVETYLKHHLRWSFVRYGGDEEPASSFPKTRITVLRGHGELRQPDEDLSDGENASHVPLYRDYTPMSSVTAGKAWGLHHIQDSEEFYHPA